MTAPGRNGAPIRACPSRPADGAKGRVAARAAEGQEARPQKQATRLAHAGRDPQRYHGFVNPPVFRGSTVLYPSVASLEANDLEFSYGRLGTPTTKALAQALAELEGGHATALTPSGLTAIAATLIALVSAGDHILVVDSVYRPTRRFCDQTLKRLRRRHDLLRSAGRRRASPS